LGGQPGAKKALLAGGVGVRVNTNDVRLQFVSILAAINDRQYDPAREGERFPFYANARLGTEAARKRYFDYQFALTRYVADRIPEAVLVDAGCGVGCLSVLLSLLGAKKVYAVDYLAEQVEQARYVVRASGSRNIDVVQADVSLLDLPPASVDGIFSIEAISHYRDYLGFLRKAADIVRPGGFLLISDGNNGASPFVRTRVRKIWDVFENLPEPIELYGHSKNELCYVRMRKRIIREAFPELPEEQAELYARFTFGYSRESTVLAAGQFMKGDYSLRSEFSRDKCPLDPESDSHVEQMFDPRKLARELEEYGFRSVVRSRGPANPRLRAIRYLWERLSSITILLPRPFLIVASKAR